jgi:hypothetical protein
MVRPGDAELLALAERGAGLRPGARAILLLRAAHPEVPQETIAGMTLSARDRALLALRAALFGTTIRCRDACGTCGEVLDLDVTADAIGLGAIGPAFPPSSRSPGIRALTAGDIAAAEAADCAATARSILRDRAAPGIEDGPALEAALEALDPAAHVELELLCPSCGTPTVRDFDVAVFVWREIEARIPRLLREVTELARAFHWSEHDILALPAPRRAYYLTEVRG